MNLKKEFYEQYLVLCAFGVSIILVMIVGLGIQIKYIVDYKQEICTLKEEIKAVEDKINKIENEEFQTEDEKLEFLARTKLGMIKRNEIIYLEK